MRCLNEGTQLTFENGRIKTGQLEFAESPESNTVPKSPTSLGLPKESALI